MTAPPSGAYKIVAVPELYDAAIKRLGIEGTYVGGSEAESPWVPFGDNAAIRHLAFDVRENVYVNILWIKGPGVIGTHKHRGKVWAIGLEGSFRYLEYDWVCKAGEFITEREQRLKLPGRVDVQERERRPCGMECAQRQMRKDRGILPG